MAIIKKILISILTFQSRIILRKYKPFIITVTGSVGKTSTKDAIFDVLSGHEKFIRKSEKSMNSEIGLPLTVIGVSNAWYSIGGWVRNIFSGLGLMLTRKEYPSCLVLEIGADHPDDIWKVTKWLKPNIAVYTKISKMPVHVEFFSSPEQVFEEKALLAYAVLKGGTVILYGDEDNTMSLKDKMKERGVKVITYGMSDGLDVIGSELKTEYNSKSGTKIPSGINLKLSMNTDTELISIPGIVGNSYVYPLLAACATGMARHMSFRSIVNRLVKYEGPKGRMKLVEGINGSVIIDDTYNSSPDAVFSALSSLQEIETKSKKIVILGDMMELGKYSSMEHKEVGKRVAQVATIFVTVGPRSKLSAESAAGVGMSENRISSLDKSDEVGDVVKSFVEKGDIILVKGSQSMRMERAVKALMAYPEKAEKELARQEREWLEKA